ncbi:MAG TPA: hypothetical protein VHB21_09450, partial [Minicystis sp.]|nr:hypothetical protein [Minicystis sp.]
MLAEGRIVFDEVIEDTSGALGTVTTYTSLEHSDFLADSQQLVFHAITHATGAVNSLTIQVETTGDGRSWQNKQTAAEFSHLVGSGVNSYTAGEAWPTRPNLRFVRLRLAAENKANPFSLYVRLYVSSRTRRSTAEPHAPREPRAAVSRASLQEIRDLFVKGRPFGSPSGRPNGSGERGHRGGVRGLVEVGGSGTAKRIAFRLVEV